MEKATTITGPYTSMGVTTLSLTAAQTGNITQTTYYRRKSTFAGCASYSNILTVTVPKAGTIGNPQTFCGNGAATYDPDPLTSLDDGGAGAGYGYQWRSSTDNVTYTNIGTDGTNETYDPPSTSATITYYIRRKTGTGCGNLDTAPIIVNKIGTTDTPTAGTINDQTICGGTTPTITGTAGAPSGGIGIVTYEWQYNTTSVLPGATWISLSETGPTYTPPSPITVTTYFRRRSKNICGNANTSGYDYATISISVLPGSLGADKSICYDTAPGTLGSGTGTSPGSATGTVNPVTYTWQSSTDGVNFTTIPLATSSTYVPGNLTATVHYRRIVSNITYPSCTPYDEILVVVKILTDPKTISSSQNICNGGSIAQLTGPAATADGTLTYLWEYSTNTTTWTSTGVTTQNYTPTVSRYYRRNAVTTCGTYSSNVVLVTTQATTTAGSISSATTCMDTPVTVGSASVGLGTGTGTITYRWEISTNNSSWSTIAGETGPTLSTGPLSATRYYRRYTVSTLFTNTCESVATATATITVKNCKVITNPMIYQRVN
jgi:hypothetical protein